MPELKGPRLVDKMVEAVDSCGLTQAELRRMFGVGETWFCDVRAGRIKSPSVHRVQLIYETLTGEALFPVGPGGGRSKDRRGHSHTQARRV
jgi:predicted transcriptional regulator